MSSGFEKNEHNNIQSRPLSEQIIFWVMRSPSNMITTPKYIGYRSMYLIGWEEPEKSEYALVSTDRDGKTERTWATPTLQVWKYQPCV